MDRCCRLFFTVGTAFASENSEYVDQSKFTSTKSQEEVRHIGEPMTARSRPGLAFKEPVRFLHLCVGDLFIGRMNRADVGNRPEAASDEAPLPIARYVM
jgi:hypothetical protein